VALAADDIRAHARVSCGIFLESECLHAGRVGDRVGRRQAELAQRGTGLGEAKLLAQAVAVIQDEIDERLEGRRCLGVGCALVLFHVQIADQDNRPSVLTGHVIQVHRAPISRGVGWEGSPRHALRARVRHTAELNRLLGRALFPVEVGQRHLTQAEVVAVPGIEVANRIRIVADKRLHPWRALHWVEAIRLGPIDRRRSTEGPVIGALLVEVAREAASAARSKSAVSHMDGLACRHGKARILRLDVLMVPRGDLAAEDLCQEASRQRQLANVNAVEDANGAHTERQVHHRLRRIL